MAKQLVNRADRRYQVCSYDLWAEAVQALIRAERGYDEESGNKFLTYAYKSVARAIWQYVLRSHVKRLKRGISLVSLEGMNGDSPRVGSPEDELLAREALLARMKAIPVRWAG